MGLWEYLDVGKPTYKSIGGILSVTVCVSRASLSAEAEEIGYSMKAMVI